MNFKFKIFYSKIIKLFFIIFTTIIFVSCGVKGPPGAPDGSSIIPWPSIYTERAPIHVKMENLDLSLVQAKEQRKVFLYLGQDLEVIREERDHYLKEIEILNRERSKNTRQGDLKKQVINSISAKIMQKQEKLSIVQETLLNKCKEALKVSKEIDNIERLVIRNYLSYKKIFDFHKEEVEYYYQNRKYEQDKIRNEEQSLKTLEFREMEKDRGKLEKRYEDFLNLFDDSQFNRSNDSIMNCKLMSILDPTSRKEENLSEFDDISKEEEDILKNRDVRREVKSEDINEGKPLKK